jgi:hypothetical protein
MANKNLTSAKKAKNDEFYTQYHDIEKEMNAYLEYDPEVFKGKTILLPCDDPEWSNFTKYFAQNFDRFGLKKLISTSYAADSKKYDSGYQPSLFETEDPKYDESKTTKHGKIFTLSYDRDRNGKIDVNDLEWQYLEGDGDFRSEEIQKLRDEADVIITNPPFSLFREFLAWIVEAQKEFVVIGSKNAITYKEVFPLIKENKMWTGVTSFNKDMLFISPEKINPADKPSTSTRMVDGVVYLRSPSIWFTNLDHGRRHQPLPLMTMADNSKFNTKVQKTESAYQKYDNYDAIEVPFTNAIPSDYEGVMGVPISFLDKYSPEQFEILGTSDNGLVDDSLKKTPGLTKKFVDDYYAAGGKGTYREGNPTAGIYDNGVATMSYKRIFIKHKNPTI